MKVLSCLPPTHYHLCPRCLNLLELQVVYVCVLGVVPWSSQVMEQSDTESGAHGQQSWMVGGQCAHYC